MLSGRFSWVINCIPSSVHVNPNSPVHPTLPSTFGIRKFVSHVRVSISVLQTSSSAPFSFLPVSSSFSVRTDPHVDVFLICYWSELLFTSSHSGIFISTPTHFFFLTQIFYSFLEAKGSLLFTSLFLNWKTSPSFFFPVLLWFSPVFPHSVLSATIRQTESTRTIFFLYISRNFRRI